MLSELVKSEINYQLFSSFFPFLSRFCRCHYSTF